MVKTILTFIIACLALAGNAADRLVVSKAPQGTELKYDFKVKARVPNGEWQDLDTYLFNVDRVANARHNVEKTSVAKFEFEGKVEIEITSLKQDIKSFRVRPASYGIQTTQDGNVIRFTLDRPRYVSVEVNGDIYNNLHIFADNILERPKVKGKSGRAQGTALLKKKDLIYFGPGIHDFKGDSIAVPSGKTVFIDNGAVIKGWLSVYKAHDVRILGHGIVMPGNNAGIQIKYSENVLVDGPLTTQLPIGGSDSVEIKNVKVMSWYGWGDGFNIFASSNISQEHLFARTSDDCSTIYCTRKGFHGGCHNISIKDCVYWADVAHPIMIGLHSETPENEDISNVIYDNIDILEQAENQIDYQGCIGINDGDNVLVKDIVFQNFNIENIRKGMLFNIRVCFNKKYCTAPGRGIENILLKNIAYNGEKPNMSIIAGYDDSRMVRNIKFENLTINGKLIFDDMAEKPKWYKTGDMANIFIGEHVAGVTFSK